MGKPLISNAQMLAMFNATLRANTLKQDARFRGTLATAQRSTLAQTPASLLAALFFQLRTADTIITQGENPLAQRLSEDQVRILAGPSDTTACALVAAGAAMRSVPATASTRDLPVTIAILNGAPDISAIADLLIRTRPPLVLLAATPLPTPEASDRAQRQTTLPTMPVDSADTVALCRVLQESLLRARQGFGATVIHAIKLAGATDPLPGLRAHLERRGIPEPRSARRR